MNGSVARIRKSELRRVIGDGLDIFIGSASYEKRCLQIPSVVAPITGIALVCHHRRLSPSAGRNLNRLIEHFRGKAVTVPIERNDPIRTADSLQAALSRVASDGKCRNYVVDITTFTHEELLILLSILRGHTTNKDSILLLYATAAEYSVGLKAEDKWLSKGVQDVRSVLGYP